MPLEIEVKLKVPSHGPIHRHLRALKAKHLGKVRETNIFFDFPKHSLRRKDSGLRVRLIASSWRKTPVNALLTFKGPPQKTGLRPRNAFDLACTPHDQLIPLLESLGLYRIFSFEKDRDSWDLDRCRIELDTLPHFGTFLEIEGPSEKAVRNVQKKIGLESLTPESKSYSHMVSRHLAQRRGKSLHF
jgi:predicted adenylyl cyclase CyaB